MAVFFLKIETIFLPSKSCFRTCTILKIIRFLVVDLIITNNIVGSNDKVAVVKY